MEKTIVAYLVAIFITIVFVKTKFADKWIFSKIRIAYWQLALLQIIGYALLFLAVYTSYITTSMKGTVYHNTPVLEIIFFIFIILPLVIGLFKGKKWILLISFLSLGIPFLFLYINDECLYHKRKHLYNNKKKIENIFEVKLPDYEVIDYEEYFGLNHGYIRSHLKIKFSTPLGMGTLCKIKKKQDAKHGFYYSNKGVTLWMNQDFTHAEIIYNDYNRDHFIAPYYYNH